MLHREIKRQKRYWIWFSKFLDWVPFSPMKKKSEVFFECIFSMIAKVAQVDGRISRSEHAVLDSFMEYDLGIDAKEKIKAIKIFDNAKRSNSPAEYYARRLHVYFSSDQRILRNSIDLLLTVAYADGNFHLAEEKMLLSIAREFKISEKTFRRLQQFHVEIQREGKSYFDKENSFDGDRADFDFKAKTNNSRPERFEESVGPYEILSCKSSDSLSQIKRIYRRLVMECHPDTLISKGLPEKFVKISEKKFIRINQAYEEILRLRGEKG